MKDYDIKGRLNIMYIDTRTKETMQQSLYELFNVSNVQLDDLFLKAGTLSMTDHYMDTRKFNTFINEFIEAEMYDKSIEYLLFFHLGRRLNSAGNSVEGKNLFELLSSENELSIFLRSHGVTFRINKQHLNLFYKGKMISLDDTSREYVPYLRWRLGYNVNRIDYCFNGFMLKDQLVRNDYARSLFHAPEFIRVLADFLNERDIITDYVEKSKYYCFEYLVPIGKVFFDDEENLTEEEKQKYLLNRVLSRLFKYFSEGNNFFDHDNPILRLDDTDEMQAEFFIKKEELTWEMLC